MKLNIGVIFGGRSGEHEVSLVSATSIIGALDKEKFNVIPIGITKDGRWFSNSEILATLKSKKAPDEKDEVAIIPEPTRQGLYHIMSGGLTPLDATFIVLHGTYGEDGTVQGLLDLAGIPYVGAGVLGSSVGMDKIVQKDVAKQSGINVTPSIWFLSRDITASTGIIIDKIEKTLGYPCFIKPANSGSSVGISKAHNGSELRSSLLDAARYDRRVLIEKGVENAREIEVGVLGNDEPVASCIGEVVPSNEFYDYDAKYVDGRSKTIVPAEMHPKTEGEIKQIAIMAFKALDVAGMARVDFLVTKDAIFFNEVNTIPGFTSISMYPKLFEASGIPYASLLERLIALAVGRSTERSKFLTSYQPKSEWYR